MKNVGFVARGTKIKDCFWPFLGFGSLFLKGTITSIFDLVFMFFAGKTSDALSTVILAISSILLFIGLVAISFKDFKFILFTLVFFALLWFASWLAHPETGDLLLSNWSPFFLTSLPYMFFFYYLFDGARIENDNPLNFIYKMSLFRIVACTLIQILIFLKPSLDIYGDYMVAGYTLLFPMMFVLACELAFRKIRFLSIIILLADVILLLLLECRGAMICFATFIFLYLFFVNAANRRGSIITLKRVVLIGLIVSGALLIQPVSSLLVSFGFDSRLLMTLSGQSNAGDTTRLEIYEMSLEAIKNNPYGMGIMADRTLYPAAWNVHYAHNIFVELGIDFGYFGFAAVVLLLIFVVVSYSKSEPILRILLLATFSMSFVRLLVSSSLWVDQFLYAMLGVCFVSFNNWKKRPFRCLDLHQNKLLTNGRDDIGSYIARV